MLQHQSRHRIRSTTALSGKVIQSTLALPARASMRPLLHPILRPLQRCLPLWGLLLVLTLSGCASHQTALSPLDEALNGDTAEEAAKELLQSDTKGALPTPHIPPELTGQSSGDSIGLRTKTLANPVEYSVVCESPEDPKLAETFLEISTLIRMQDRPIHSFTALEQRLETSLKEGRDILHSFGYYTGQVYGSLDFSQESPSAPTDTAAGTGNGVSAKATVRVHFIPGPQYTLGNTVIAHTSQQQLDRGEIRVADIFPPADDTDNQLPASANSPAHVSAESTAAPTLSGQDKASPAQDLVSSAQTAPEHSARDQAGPDQTTTKTSPERTTSARTATEKADTSPSTSGAVLLLYDFHPEDAPPLPRTLADVGLEAGSPALADDVLKAVDKVQETFRNSGYPEARITSTRYFLNHQSKTLDVEMHILPGPFIRMGDIVLQQEASVDKNYLLAKQTWKKGEAWNQNKIEAYRDQLRQTGLFVSIGIEPGPREDSTDIHSIAVSLAPAPERTIGGSLKYDTSFGPGVQAFWEHRNLTGNGDSLRLELPVWMDMQELTAKYRLPFFVRDDQDFIAQLGILNQDLDAYNLQAARISMGIDRRLSRHWKLTVQGSAEGGSLKDPKKPREEYLMYGMPVNLAFDSTNDLLDATRGGRASLNLAPYIGEYRDDFTVLRSRLDLQRFVRLSDDESLILALRGTVGTMSGGNAQRVPPSVRFYSGGGGSVRGYEYQSLGPRNYRDDPLGGSALTEVVIEPRWRFSETFGVVAFVDGGMAHEDIDDLGKDLRWGAGVGFRLYTPIGPVRFDVATPLTPRDDDEPVQFYISIGQSF